MGWKARMRGREACLEGNSRDSNPHTDITFRDDRVDRRDWFKGYDSASRDSYNSKLFSSASDKEIANDDDDKEGEDDGSTI